MEAALLALKRKKMYDDQLERNMNSRITLETQIQAIESANVNLETFKAMQTGADAMKRIHGELNIDKVDKTMDDIRDQMDLSKEISDAISQPLGVGVDLDDVCFRLFLMLG
jgi:charged multivesicular body protein 4A/B